MRRWISPRHDAQPAIRSACSRGAAFRMASSLATCFSVSIGASATSLPMATARRLASSSAAAAAVLPGPRGAPPPVAPSAGREAQPFREVGGEDSAQPCDAAAGVGSRRLQRRTWGRHQEWSWERTPFGVLSGGPWILRSLLTPQRGCCRLPSEAMLHPTVLRGHSWKSRVSITEPELPWQSSSSRTSDDVAYSPQSIMEKL